jgi:DNA (cytosine-5)-methyltransferase 1
VIKLVELFGGIGAVRKALERENIEFESVGYVEIDKNACKSYNALYNENYSPMSVCDYHLPEEQIDLLVHGSPCFTADTLVLTRDSGYKKITDINCDDFVLTHDNRYKRVVNFLEQGKKEIYRIGAMGFDCLETTPNHRFYVREREISARTKLRSFGEPKWVACENLTKDSFLGVAINQESKLPNWNGVECTRGKDTYKKNNLPIHDDRFWYLVGRYLGDGWVRRRRERNNHLSGTIICCGKHKLDKFVNEIGDLLHYCLVEERTVYKLQFSNKELATFLDCFGEGASNKKLPGFVFNLPVPLLKRLLDGYFDSDGHIDKNNVVTVSSVSRELIYGIAQCVAKVYHQPYSIYKRVNSETAIIEGRVVHQKNCYILCFRKEPVKVGEAFYEDGYIWFPIREITVLTEKKDVFDITVEDDHSFTANGCIVHNCTQFSTAGLRTGGVEGSGTESSLMWETVRIIREADYKPKIVIWENVENTMNYPEYSQYIDALNELGYVSSYKVLNSLDFGIPQTRNRVFTVSILNGDAFNFDNLQTTPMENIDKFVDRTFYSDKYRVADRTLAVQFGKLPNNPFNGRNMLVGDYARTIVSNYAKVPTSNILAVGDKYRHITEKESWLLMGFDESDFEKAQALYPQRYIGGKECMCGILYRQAGNSIVVQVLQAIIRELKQYF